MTVGSFEKLEICNAALWNVLLRQRNALITIADCIGGDTQQKLYREVASLEGLLMAYRELAGNPHWERVEK